MGAGLQTKLVAQRPSIGGAAALKQTKKSLASEIERTRASGIAAPNSQRQRDAGRAVRGAEMHI